MVNIIGSFSSFISKSKGKLNIYHNDSNIGGKIMIILDNLGELKKGRLWINQVYNLQYGTNKIVKSHFKANNTNEVSIANIVLELLLMPRHVSNYALLGASFTPTSGELLEVRVNISQYNGEVTKDSIAMPEDEVHLGIPEEYAEGIVETTDSVIKEIGGFPSGILEFNVGAHGYVGSSILTFSKITSIILKIMIKKIDNMDVEKIKEEVALEIMKI